MVLPKLIVFDLDDCLWSPEMYTLSSCPSVPVKDKDGLLCIGLQVPRGPTVTLFDGARRVLEHLYEEKDTTYKNVKFGLASSSEEPTFSNACLNNIEIVPGVKMGSLFDFQQIGRTGKLTSNKTSHFNELKAESGIDLKHSLFFDDCNWGDHCSVVNKAFGVVGMRTPNGLQWSEWERALEKYTKERG